VHFDHDFGRAAGRLMQPVGVLRHEREQLAAPFERDQRVMTGVWPCCPRRMLEPAPPRQTTHFRIRHVVMNVREALGAGIRRPQPLRAAKIRDSRFSRDAGAGQGDNAPGVGDPGPHQRGVAHGDSVRPAIVASISRLKHQLNIKERSMHVASAARALVFGIVMLALCASGRAAAQDVTGSWQGTLQAPRPLRIVVKITADGGALKAVMYSIDQGGQGLAASTISVQGATVRFAVAAIGASYEGKLSADGASMSGSFSQGGAAIPLELVRASGEAAWTIPTPPAAMRPMAADAKPAFDVATIKPSNPDAQGKLFTVRGRQVVTIGTTVGDLLGFAYEVHPKQISGGPAWLTTDRYDITGQPDVDGVPNQTQLRVLVQKLLADRFKLAFHREQKELSVYALVVGSKGPTLTKSEGDPNGLPSLLFRGLGTLPARNASMADFARVMQAAVLDRPVVDRTALGGRYDFTLTWTPDETQFAAMGVKVPPPPADATTPGLFTAVQEQLGLKFDSTRAPVEVLVVDRVDRPSAN
jgi:uncharacterized protein (TIGR03435 family)